MFQHRDDKDENFDDDYDNDNDNHDDDHDNDDDDDNTGDDNVDAVDDNDDNDDEADGDSLRLPDCPRRSVPLYYEMRIQIISVLTAAPVTSVERRNLITVKVWYCELNTEHRNISLHILVAFYETILT